jgi:hypothetical protein
LLVSCFPSSINSSINSNNRIANNNNNEPNKKTYIYKAIKAI